MKKIFTVLILATAFVFSLTHCESTDDNDVAEAQQCLNSLSPSASPPQVQACGAKINGIFTPEAEVVRCSLDFFAGGITPASFDTAFTNAQSGSSSTSMAALISGLILVDPVAGIPTVNYAQTTYDDCAASGVPSFLFIAGLAQTGTDMSVGAGGSTNPATIVTTCQTTPASCSPAAVGTIAQTLGSTYCSATSGNASSQACSILQQALSAGGSSATIGQNIFCLLNNMAVGC